MMKIVIDSSAIFSCKGISSDNELYTTPGIISEIKPGGRVRKQLDYLLAAGLIVKAPDIENINDVKHAAEKTGDIGRLSHADIEVIALAKELSAVIISDDYSIQNLSTEIGIKYMSVEQKGITKVLKWDYVCKGCGLRLKTVQESCPICGSSGRPVRNLEKNH